MGAFFYETTTSYLSVQYSIPPAVLEDSSYQEILAVKIGDENAENY